MKIRLERDVLAEAVQWVARTLPSRPSVPVLAGLLVRTDDNGIVFSGFDYESSGQVQVAATVHDEGEALVSGKLFADISKQLPNHPVEIEADESKMVLTCGHVRFVLQTLPLAEYPALPTMPPVAGTVDTSVFNEAVSQVAVAARRDSDSRPMTTSVRVEINGDRMSLMASDLYRLAYKELTWSPPASPNASMEALVKAKTLADIAKSMTSGEEITIALSDNSEDGLIGFQVSGSAGQRQSTTRLMDHEFPKVRQLLEIEPLVTVRVDTAELIAAARRVALVAESNTPAADAGALRRDRPGGGYRGTRPRPTKRSTPSSATTAPMIR